MRHPDICVLYMLAVTMAAPVAKAADCDCTHRPIQPIACYKPCQTAALLKANPNELRQAFKLDKETADAIVDARQGHTITGMTDLKSILPSKNYSVVVKGLSTVTPENTVSLGSKYDLRVPLTPFDAPAQATHQKTEQEKKEEEFNNASHS